MCAAVDSGRWTPVRPRSPHTTPQVPIAVSKSAKYRAMFTSGRSEDLPLQEAPSKRPAATRSQAFSPAYLTHLTYLTHVPSYVLRIIPRRKSQPPSGPSHFTTWYM